MPQLLQLPRDATVAPVHVLRGKAHNEILNLLGERWSTHALGHPPPRPLLLPAPVGLRLHHMDEVLYRVVEQPAEPEEPRPLLGAHDDSLRGDACAQDTNLSLEELNLCVVAGLEPAPTLGNEGEKQVVHGASLGVGLFLQVPLRQAVAGHAYIFAHPGLGVPGRPEGRSEADRPTGIAGLIQTRASGPSPVHRARLG